MEGRRVAVTASEGVFSGRWGAQRDCTVCVGASATSHGEVGEVGAVAGVAVWMEEPVWPSATIGVGSVRRAGGLDCLLLLFGRRWCKQTRASYGAGGRAMQRRVELAATKCGQLWDGGLREALDTRLGSGSLLPPLFEKVSAPLPKHQHVHRISPCRRGRYRAEPLTAVFATSIPPHEGLHPSELGLPIRRRLCHCLYCPLGAAGHCYKEHSPTPTH